MGGLGRRGGGREGGEGGGMCYMYARAMRSDDGKSFTSK